MSALFIGVAQQTATANVEAVMYLDTEMPCVYGEALSGRIVIHNKGEDDIKLAGRADFPELLVLFQLALLPAISEQEMIAFYAGNEKAYDGYPSRSTIKRCIDSWGTKNENIILLKKGDSREIKFDDFEIKISDFLRHAGYVRKRIPFKVELYLSPDTWVPVEVHPPIVVDCGAKITSLTATKAGPDYDGNAAWVYRAQIGTNEVLFVREKYIHHRLSDLQPDDVVTHSNNTITITPKDGKVRTIPETDIARVSAERTEEKRKMREQLQKGEN
jgi:hypothetical protein